MAFVQNTKREREIEMATKKEKMISVNEIEKAAETEYKSDTTIRWGGLDIKVKPNLTAEEMKEFYVTVIKATFDDDGDYNPVAKIFASRAATIALYTNVKLPQNTDRAYKLLYWTNLYDEVISMIDKNQFDHVMLAIEDEVHYLCETKISKVVREIESASAAITDFTDGMGDVLSGVSPDVFRGFITNMANHGVNDEAIAREVVRAKYEEEAGA